MRRSSQKYPKRRRMFLCLPVVVESVGWSVDRSNQARSIGDGVRGVRTLSIYGYTQTPAPSTPTYDLPEVRLDLDLPAELMLHATLEQLGLAQHLERHDVLGAPLPGEVHRAWECGEMALRHREEGGRVHTCHAMP